MRNLMIFGISLLVLSLSLLATPVLAEEFAITKIGAISLNGKTYNHFWYEPTNLTLQGTGSRGANIDVTIDGSMKTVKASVDDGTWKYTHDTAMEKKDHNVTVASGDQKISFVLTIGAGQVPADQLTKGATQLPQTGSVLPTLGILSLIGILLYFGFREKKI